MILDEKELKILREFCRLKENESTTTWRMMKKIYPDGGDREHKQVLRNIENMAKYGLFMISEKNNGRGKISKEYTLIKDKVKFCKSFKFSDKICKAFEFKMYGYRQAIEF